MAKQIIRLTENELHELVSESVMEYMIAEGLFNRNRNRNNNGNVPVQQPTQQGPGFFKRLGTKISAGLQAGAAANPNNRFYSGAINLSNKLGGNDNRYYTRTDDSLEAYAQRRGYKGNRRMNRRDERDFEEFMKRKGYTK